MRAGHQRSKTVKTAIRFGVPAIALVLCLLFVASGRETVSAGSQDRKGALTAQVTAGQTVVFSGHGGGASFFGGVWLDFGDGEQALFCPPGSGCGETSTSHTYGQPGTYHAELVGVGEGGKSVLAEVTVAVAK